MRSRRGVLFFLILPFLLTPSWAVGKEEGSLVLNLPTGWHVKQSRKLGDHTSILYLKAGETTYTFTEIVMQDVFSLARGMTVKKIAGDRQKMLRTVGCKTAAVSANPDGKRSLYRYDCATSHRSGVTLTVEGDDARIYAVSYELRKDQLELADQARLISFLNENAKICKRSDPTKCVR